MEQPTYFKIPSIDNKLHDDFCKLKTKFNKKQRLASLDCLRTINEIYEIFTKWSITPVKSPKFASRYGVLDPNVNTKYMEKLTGFAQINGEGIILLVPRGVLISKLDGTNNLALSWQDVVKRSISLTSTDGEVIKPNELESFHSHLEALVLNLNAAKLTLSALK